MLHSRSPSPTSLLEETIDDGFMVVPVWEPSAEVQIGSVVLEDPFLGFGPTTAPVLPPPTKAFAVTTADAAFVDAANSQLYTPQAPVPAHAQPLSHLPQPHPPPPPPQPHPPQQYQDPLHAQFSQQPQAFPPPPQTQSQPRQHYEPPHGADFFSTAAKDGASVNVGLGWWEESGPVSAFESLDAGGVPPPHDLLEHQNSVEAFLGFPEQQEVTIDAEAGPPVPPASTEPLKSPEDILNEIYAEANQLESEASSSPEGGDWWTEAEGSSTEGSPSPSLPLDAAFDDTFKADLLDAVSGDSSGRAVLSLEAGSIPPEALTAGRQLNLVLHIKEPQPSASARPGKRGPKIRATVSIAPGPGPSKRRKLGGGSSSKLEGGRGSGAPRAKRGEAKERKKAQNRVAATKYREKKRGARDVLLKALEEQEDRRASLKRAEEDAMNEIAYLKDLLHKVQHKKDQEVTI